MSVRVQVPRKARSIRFALKPAGKIILITGAALMVLFISLFAYFYSKYARLTDEKLARGPLPNSSLLYASPEPVMVGDAGSRAEIAVRLRQSGYSEDGHGNKMGWFHLRPDAIEIFPGPDSYFDAEPGVIRFADGKVRISFRSAIILREPNMTSNRSSSAICSTRAAKKGEWCGSTIFLHCWYTLSFRQKINISFSTGDSILSVL